MRVEVQFTHTGSSEMLGSFQSGDRAFVSAEHAKHLVEIACCAKYVQLLTLPQPPVNKLADAEGGRINSSKKLKKP